MLFNLQPVLAILPLLTSLSSAGLVPQKRADICGKKGYDSGKGNYDYNNSGKYSTYATCSARCVSDTKCKSFGFGGKECLLFNIALSGNFDVDSSSPDTYYDRSCISSTSSSSSSVTSTKSTTTTTKTTASSTLTTKTSSSTSKSSTSALTTSSSSTSTSSGTITTTSTSVTIPAGCTGIPTTISMTSFNWFNSTHNLDCANPNYPSDATVCWNSATNTVCANSTDTSCTCTPYCYTGLPSSAYQPLGYGPPDTIFIGLEGGVTCSAANAQSIRRNELGEGHFDCGSAADIIGFYGDSNKDTGNTGSVYYNSLYGARCNNQAPRYTASFPLTCTHDVGNNATCTAPVPLSLTLSGWV
ncbi:hypothetical protein VMCG_08225 [Cytospora schulzeri]|uniref:Apple domain-containing protein n=1 Tax=Cytospora schulzeri TaxID=448051 RepID=A0A423VSL1_9PEZI|nr:hypothetical protein VMCG_08225 [Valsa malicola]